MQFLIDSENYYIGVIILELLYWSYFNFNEVFANISLEEHFNPIKRQCAQSMANERSVNISLLNDDEL